MKTEMRMWIRARMKVRIEMKAIFRAKMMASNQGEYDDHGRDIKGGKNCNNTHNEMRVNDIIFHTVLGLSFLLGSN